MVSRGRWVDLPCVMAILNATPDSFYEGGRAATVDAALRAVADGAAVLDIGGESTRPGSAAVAAAEQIRRVVPLISAVRAQSGVAITVDTTSAEVAAAALDAGANGINDVSAGLEDAGMLRLAAARGAGIVLMHRALRPSADRYSDQYASSPMDGDVVAEVIAFLKARAEAALAAGVAREGIVLDPGLGFGKTVEQNMELIRRTGELAALGFPVLSGISRKSFVGRVSLGRDSTPGERLAGTLALTVLHRLAGASVFRAHDVGEVSEVLRAAAAVGG
jgi:dihydropteroate synthase